MQENVSDIITENARRRAAMYADFNPYTGLGSVGDRARVDIPDFSIPTQWLPVAMLDVPLVRKILAAGSIRAFIASEFPDITDPAEVDDVRLRVIDRFVRLRCRHDFPFWAATFVYIKNKGGGADVLFRLTYPQRRFVERLESMRLAGRPIRIVMLKARQWGGSTTSQMYMAWLQLVHQVGLNSLIVSQVQDASIKIKEMFRRMVAAYPADMLSDYPSPQATVPAASAAGASLVRVGGSDNTQLLPERNCTISVGTAEKPDSVRSGDYSLVHCSEVGLWRATEGRKPEDIVRSACSGVLYRPLTMIVYESTANGVGNFFHREYLAAADPNVKSQFEAFFVPWFDIELYSIPFVSDADRLAFARRLFDCRLSEAAPSDREEPGRYLWWLWQRGATLEGIHWYVEERAKYHDHGSMASEYPSDDIEAFVNSGANVFDRYLVEQLRPACRAPKYVGEIYGLADDGPDALSSLRFTPDSQGLLSIWSLPESAQLQSPISNLQSPPLAALTAPPSGGWGAPSDAGSPTCATAPRGSAAWFAAPALTVPGDSGAGSDFVADRYLVVVDVGGRSSKADWSVIVVFDRAAMLDSGGTPSVVAQWYGHTDIDRLAWRAAQIAAFYDDALLVIESNTLETHDRTRLVDGDQSAFILNQIKDVYPNLYARPQSPDEIRQGIPRRYGFHTNTATKPMIISTLVKCIRDHLYVERDSRCLDEYINYERRPNGSYGAVVGCHDDLLMTRAIGLHICFHDMPLPSLQTPNSSLISPNSSVISEASI